MKHAAVALALTTLLFAETSVLAKARIEPPAPNFDTPPPIVVPYGVYAGPLFLVVPAPDRWKNTGAANPCTPDPTRNTPGAEAKS